MALAAAGCAPATIRPTPSPTLAPLACKESGAVQTVDVDASTRINVYLPPCYPMNPDQRYPSLYLFPGFSGNEDSFVGSGMVTSWSLWLSLQENSLHARNDGTLAA